MFFGSMTTLQDICRPIEDDFRSFEQSYEQTLSANDQPLLEDVLRHIMSRRGKQLRPRLVLLAAKLCRGITDKTIQTAIALELLHTASLIHDDVVDSSPKRRGIDAVQMRWGNKVAVLVGDFILSQVMSIVCRLHNQSIMSILASLSAQLSSGEIMQLHSNATMWITEEQYYRIIEQKTAQLFAACTEAGAESSCASMRQTSALRQYGLHLGMCFQLKDDVLDYSDSEELGKPTMNDIRDGKATLPLLIALQRASREEANHIRSLAESLAHDTADSVYDVEQEIKAFVLRYEGMRYAHKRMLWHKEKAVEALQAFHDSVTKQSLINLIDYAINRVQ